MLRIALIDLLLFLLPFVLYAAWVWLSRRGSGRRGGIFDDAPIHWLLIAGALLVIGALAYFISFSGAPPGGVYEPPKFEGGKIKPGHIEPGKTG